MYNIISFYTGFQFRYGSIRILEFVYLTESGRMFQFRYGSIRIACKETRGKRYNYRFQFRYGSIRIVEQTAYINDLYRFQFRYGSIRILTALH